MYQYSIHYETGTGGGQVVKLCAKAWLHSERLYYINKARRRVVTASSEFHVLNQNAVHIVYMEEEAAKRRRRKFVAAQCCFHSV